MDVDNGGPNFTPENNVISVPGVPVVVILDVICAFAANVMEVDVNGRIVVLIKDEHLTIAARNMAMLSNFETIVCAKRSLSSDLEIKGFRKVVLKHF